ncbi:hypothetical protein N7517_008020 [Penicillium concentricum]|uniref:ZZ-type domain-containing protein n=1 Tax=Penicillium concentricum TaxID=293559 RepID=A0A9W9RUB5_9EURO|nr:uncharacterized protein N7517_008020 [Penicillium concentricum]KAJ5365134.1 hypothetical protein N7517_008020 [Penicillium concentricum]
MKTPAYLLVTRLVHYTTQEFFQCNRSTWFPNANYDIGSICVAYLSCDIFKSGHCQTVEDFISRREHCPFGTYAAAFWGTHIRECEADGEQPQSEEAIITLLLDTPKVNSCMQFMLSIPQYSDDDDQYNSVHMESEGYKYSLSTAQIATGLHLAAYFELPDVAQKLISFGSSVDCVDAAERTPLSWAMEHNRLDSITLLLSHGADPNIKDSEGIAPLVFPIYQGCERAVQLLIEENSDLLSSFENGQLLLHVSARGGSEKVTRLLLEQGISAHSKDHEGHTPLFHAARCDHLNLVQLFLDWDLDANPQDIELDASISVAAEFGNEAIVQFLLDKGADPNNLYYGDRTPLMWASVEGQTSAIQVLLKWGVELETKNSKGQTALSFAAMGWSTEKAIQLLLENGADVNSEDNDGRSMFFHAASEDEHTNLIALFTSTKIRNIHQPDRYGRTPLHVAATRGHLQPILTLLNTDGVELEIKDYRGHTALHCAAACPRIQVVQLLLENGADINSEDNDGRSVFSHAASENRYTNLTALFTSTKIRNIHRPDRYGRTPLHIAATHGHLQSVLTLLKSDGVDCEAQDKFGRTVLSDATLRKRFDVVKILDTFSETSSQMTVDSVVQATSLEDVNVCCDVCTVYVLKGKAFSHCATCHGGDFDICEVCYHVGARCLDRSHLMELRHEKGLAP